MTAKPRNDRERTALLSVIAACVLVAIKLGAGLASGSLGLIAEALHSGTDLVAALLTLFAVRVAVRPPDRDHQYGHGKAEHLAALGEAGFLALASLYIGWRSLDRLLTGHTGHVEGAWYAIAVLVVVIGIDATRALVSWRASKALGSPALASNALHFASDLLGSVAVLIGLLFVRAGYPEADAIAALAVAVLVITAALRLARGNIDVLMDRAPAAAADAARRQIAEDEPQVDLRRLRVRESAGAYFVDAVVGVRPDAGVGRAHALADSIEASVRRALPRADVVVHVEPGAGRDVRERVNAAALAVSGVREVHNVRVMEVDGRPEVSLHLKLPPTLTLERAHEVAEEVEAAIRGAAPELSDVHTHIEPLSDTRESELPVEDDIAGEREVITAVVCELTGRPPEDLRLRRGADGRLVALLTICVEPEQPLRAAHAVATEIEERVRRRAPAVAEVVVHTEPR